MLIKNERLYMKKPSIGDLIEHTEPCFARTKTGKVVQLLSDQFVYKTLSSTEDEKHFYPKDGHGMCMYSEDWKTIK
jgi:hypothetical protein|tara:strand:- start:8490 stop:8717 length:228 start_codon:yes stop_codon:yes gene_type:complete